MKGIWGKKIGMTQIFSEKKVTPVTVIDVSSWRVISVKTEENSGYNAVQMGLLRDAYLSEPFSVDWLKNLKDYFCLLREVKISSLDNLPKIGDPIDFSKILTQNEKVDIVGTSIGRGFQGVVKRHGFHGGRASHGDKLGRKPGSLSCFRRQGRVRKGKLMPGHMGVERCTIKNSKVIGLEPEKNMILIKGAVPGKTGSLVFVRKCG